jgi:diguanylate cyclase (GGDEF)-like protein
MSLMADCAISLAFLGLMTALATASRHASMRGATRYALGHAFFTVASIPFVVMIANQVSVAVHPWTSWWALLVAMTGCALMVDGLARLLEHPRRPQIIRAAWAVALLISLTALVPWGTVEPLRRASDLTNTFGMLGMTIILLRPVAAPYRLPAVTAGLCTAFLVPMYFVGALQVWLHAGPVIVPRYEDWAWLDLAIWSTVNLCVMMLASFRSITLFAQRSRTDPLTNCLNRAGLRNELARLPARQGAGDAISVLALDIDHFKAINDRHGHAAGDEYLFRFAELVQACIREADLFVRMGGEEFIVILVDAKREVAERVAKNIIDATRRMEADFGGSHLRTTVSVGIACGQGHGDVATLMGQADAALYAAKSQGRDRACVADHPTQPQRNAPVAG